MCGQAPQRRLSAGRDAPQGSPVFGPRFPSVRRTARSAVPTFFDVLIIVQPCTFDRSVTRTLPGVTGVRPGPAGEPDQKRKGSQWEADQKPKGSGTEEPGVAGPVFPPVPCRRPRFDETKAQKIEQKRPPGISRGEERPRTEPGDTVGGPSFGQPSVSLRLSSGQPLVVARFHRFRPMTLVQPDCTAVARATCPCWPFPTVHALQSQRDGGVASPGIGFQTNGSDWSGDAPVAVRKGNSALRHPRQGPKRPDVGA